MAKAVIFDIDGTLSDPTHRLHHIKNGKHDWDSFFKEADKDGYHEPIVWLAETLNQDIPILLVSGRPESTRDITEKWLKDGQIEYNSLHMRPTGDYRPDDIIKSEILDHLIADGWEILFVVDDRARVVKMWRERGLTCLQCREWEEHYREGEDGLLTLMVGPSGAGKSRWIWGETAMKEFGIFGSQVVSSDQIRRDLCGDFKDQSKNAQVFRGLHAIVKARLINGLPTVVDATNIRPKDRTSLVGLTTGDVRYIVLNRTVAEKKRTGTWRNHLQVDGEPFDLISKHDQIFRSNLKAILAGDGYSNVKVFDLREFKE